MSKTFKRSKFSLLAVILLVGVSLFYTSDITQTETPELFSNEKKPFAFANNTYLREFGESGELELEVKADKSFYFNDDALITTESPTIWYTNEQGDKLRLNAESGQFNADTGNLYLEDRVKLSRTSSEGQITTILTQDLNIDTRNDFISTDREVSITQDKSTLKSIGLEASLNDRKIELSQRVRGIYDLAN
ncbi:MAG: LPS export ABC transporter periplasmic protein LptC [Oleiphilaceae bacterium]|nr:LPS export ABC transporter periplasmic protein LptC [Oleiphilaceae bacterium]